MNKQGERRAGKYQPGIWSTDEYIRAWAIKQGRGRGECLVPLQSLNDSWIARIRFDKPGQPVERIMERQAAEQLEVMMR